MDNYEKLSVAVNKKDQVNAGQAFGTFISLLLMFEIPEQTTTKDYQPAESMMPWAWAHSHLY